MAKRSKANPALRRNAPSSNNNFAPHQSSLAPCARSKSSAPACDARIDETNMLHRWRLLSPTLQSRRTRHDCRRHHSSEESPGVRGGACSALKNNPAFATLRLPRITSRFPYPKTCAFSPAVRLCAFLIRLGRRQPACPASSKPAAANPSQMNLSAAPSSLGHAKNLARKPSSRPQPITALLARAFLPFLPSPLCVPQHFPKEYSREVAILRMAFVKLGPKQEPKPQPSWWPRIAKSTRGDQLSSSNCPVGQSLPHSHHPNPQELSRAKGGGILRLEPAHSPRGIKPCHASSLCAWHLSL